MNNRCRTPIADSPWFWFALFTGVGLTFLTVTGGKFSRRQSGIERRYQHDEWVRAKQARGEWTEADAAATKKSPAGIPGKSVVAIPKYSTPGNTLISLPPLLTTMGILCAASTGMLIRERLQQRDHCGDEEKPPAGATP